MQVIPNYMAENDYGFVRNLLSSFLLSYISNNPLRVLHILLSPAGIIFAVVLTVLQDTVQSAVS